MAPAELVIARKVKEKVEKIELCQDPDGSGLLWSKTTGERLSTEGRETIGTDRREFQGKCFDTCEYYSHLGELIKQLSQVAPQGTSLMVVETSTCSGTKTFFDEATATYYK